MIHHSNNLKKALSIKHFQLRRKKTITVVFSGLLMASIHVWGDPRITINPLSTGKILLTNEPKGSTVMDTLLPPKELGFGPQSLERMYSTQSSDDLLSDEIGARRPRWNPPTGGSVFSSGNSNFELSLNVPEEFQCSLFDNPDHASVLSAIQSLNQTINSPSCNKSAVNGEAVLANTQKIKETITKLREQFKRAQENPAEGGTLLNSSSETQQSVNEAILAALDLAKAFGNQDLFQENCAPATGGQILLSMNKILNGLTPYALMVASSSGVGGVAVPFLMGGAALSSAIETLNQALHKNDLNLEDPNIRKAILEKQCQFIKITQRNMFLLYERSEQVRKISEDITKSKTFFNNVTGQIPSETLKKYKHLEKKDSLLTQMEKNHSQLLIRMTEVKSKLSNLQDNELACSLARSFLGGDQASYMTLPYAAMDLLEQVMQFRTLSTRSPAYSILEVHKRTSEDLSRMLNGRPLSQTESTNCARWTRTWINAVESGLGISDKIIKEEKQSLDIQTQQDPDFAIYRSLEKKLSEKEQMGNYVDFAMSKLKDYASVLTRSEIGEELQRLRKGLLSGQPPSLFGKSLALLSPGKSPVQQWFDYKFEKHSMKVSLLHSGRKRLRTKASNALIDNKVLFKNLEDRKKWVTNLWSLNKKYLPANTPAHKIVCQDLRDTWFNYIAAVDHLASTELFCSMLEPILSDSSPSEIGLIDTCLGPFKRLSNNRYDSKVQRQKISLVTNKTKDWALHVWKILKDLQCQTATE